ILNILGVKYVLNKNDGLLGNSLSPDPTFNNKKYELVWQDAPWQVYENRAAVPRTFLTSDYVIVQDKNETIKTFFTKDFNESKTIILNQDPHIEGGGVTIASARITDYKPNLVTIAAKTNRDSL